jgi:F-type H+-transporting ATPase subunit b
MTRRRTLGLAVVAIVLAATSAWAEEHGGAALGQIIVRVVNFVIAAGVLVWVFTRVFSLRDFFAGRRTAIEADIAESQQRLEGAKLRLTEIEERVARQPQEAQEIAATGTRQAEAEAKRIIAAGHERSQRLAESARMARAQEEKRMAAELQREMVESALRAAEALVAERMDEADHRRLVEEALSE